VTLNLKHINRMICGVPRPVFHNLSSWDAMFQVAHPLLNAMRANTPAFGAWLTLPGAAIARTIALAHPAISWLCFDAEHGLIGLGGSTLFETFAALKSLPNGGPSPIVRIPATAESDSIGWQIKLALDGGARGILVPMCPDAQAARRVAQAARFPTARGQTAGIRGLGNPFAHTLWGDEKATMRDYLDQASEGVVVMVQIETVEGMNNVDEIAATEGVG
jgi:4-hydroxy-2-oxoheptanedioate aldolase